MGTLWEVGRMVSDRGEEGVMWRLEGEAWKWKKERCELMASWPLFNQPGRKLGSVQRREKE